MKISMKVTSVTELERHEVNAETGKKQKVVMHRLALRGVGDEADVMVHRAFFAKDKAPRVGSVVEMDLGIEAGLQPFQDAKPPADGE